ncbi:MAG: peptide chain release factor N(5)-glutamine methyltransferase [Alphaproteobacteria bacterium]|nr:peptide chain release factor N(5)-glutamine methyltransferase [Alphaproteobacteria bacterium]
MSAVSGPQIRDLLHDAAARLSAAGVPGARLDARILLAHAMNVTRDELIAAGRPPTADEASQFASLLARRLAREPIAYITGRKEFWSLDFAVGPGVLVPRPDTETLVEAAIALFADRHAALRIADLGTGSGAILVALLKELPGARGIGFERSGQALTFARANLESHGLAARGEIAAEDWNTASGPFDLVVSNPPYIPTADIDGLEPEIRLYEPRAALDGGPDGLDAYRNLSSLLPDLLCPGGTALLELGEGQTQRVKSLFQGLQVRQIVPDLAGISRVLVLKKPN